MKKLQFIYVLVMLLLLPQTADAIPYHISVDGNDNNPGTQTLPFKTISQAAEIAQPGDTIIVHKGVYRERVSPVRGGKEGKPIIYMAAPGEKVIIKGSDVWSPEWKKIENFQNIFAGKLSAKMFKGYNPYHIQLGEAAKGATLGQVFVDGEEFKEVASEKELRIRPGSWWYSPDTDEIYVHFKGSNLPENRLVEITTRPRIFAPHKRGLGYITVRGFIMEHCANQYPAGFWEVRENAQAGALGTRSGHHWVIENNTIRYAKTIGLDIGSESIYDIEGKQPKPGYVGYHLVKNNIIIDNGACGIAGWKHIETRIVGNVIKNNNNLGFTAAESAGIKVHEFINGLIEGNLIIDNKAFGIWLDNVWQGSRLRRNVILGNRQAGIFVELGKGSLLIDNNIIGNNRTGISCCEASNITVAHNLIFSNKDFGITAECREQRNFAIYPPNIKSFPRREPLEPEVASAANIEIFNNLLLNNKQGAVRIPSGMNNTLDYNVVTADTAKEPFKLKTGKDMSDEEIAGAARNTVGAHNVITTGTSVRFNNRNFLLELDVDFVPSNVGSKPVSGLDNDFFGNPILQGKIDCPGPFQNLAQEEKFVIWKGYYEAPTNLSIFNVDLNFLTRGFIPNRIPVIWILAIGTTLLALTCYFPLIGGVLLLASIPLPFKQHILTSTIYPCDLVFPVVFAGWLIHRIFTGQVASLKGRKIFLFFSPLLLAGIISGLNAKDMFRYGGYLYLWVQIPFAYLMVVNIIKSRKHLNIILYTIFTVCVLFSLFYIFSFLYTHFRYFPSLHKIFSLSGNIHKNIAALYIGLALPLFLGVFFLNLKAKLKIPLFILIAICFSGLMFTCSRLGIFSGSMGLVFLIFVFALTKDKDKANYKGILSCIILLYSMFFIYVWFFARDLFMKGWGTFYGIPGRVFYYKWAFKLFKEHPIIGLGMGNFLYYTGIKHPHSMVMQILTEVGLLGIAGILFLLWNLIKYLIVTLGSCASRYRYIIWAGLACLICFFIDNIFDFTLFHGMGIQVGVILALIDSGKKWNT